MCRLSTDLNLANKILKEAHDSDRELKDKFKSLRKAVEHILVHLQRLEKENKAAKA